MKVVINRCFGGFGISQAGYKRLIELGVPVRRYVQQKRDRKTGLWKPEPKNEGMVIFNDGIKQGMRVKYWLSCFRTHREDPLLVKMVEDLGQGANGEYADLRVVEIPDDIEWKIEEYDGMETIEEAHRSWC